MDTPDRFGATLRDLRKARALTQDETARAVGVTRSIWSQWEGGHLRPHHKRLARIADFFGMDDDARERLGAAYFEPSQPPGEAA